MAGNFIISLDFELHWGFNNDRSVESYKSNLINTPKAIELLLNNFIDYNIEASWATVGFLYFQNKTDLIHLKKSSILIPDYLNNNLNNYDKIANLGANEKEDPFHFAPSLIKKISETKGQEISTHTFSHYYVLAENVNYKKFEIDLIKAIEIAKSLDLKTESIIFPRNQYDSRCLEICQNLGIKSYRGTEKFFIYKPTSNNTKFKKFLRLLDSYINISGDNTFILEPNKNILNIPSSRFLRPFDSRFQLLEDLRLKRILNEMSYAAKNNRNYHLWWHPHNFGAHLEENFDFLKKILSHYQFLNHKYGFQSINMKNLQKKYEH